MYRKLKGKCDICGKENIPINENLLLFGEKMTYSEIRPDKESIIYKKSIWICLECIKNKDRLRKKFLKI